MDHLVRRASFVEVAAASDHEDPMPADADRPAARPVPARRIGREEGEGVERDGVGTPGEEIGGSRKTAAQHDEDVVALDAEAACQLAGAVRRPFGCVVHDARW